MGLFDDLIPDQGRTATATATPDLPADPPATSPDSRLFRDTPQPAVRPNAFDDLIPGDRARLTFYTRFDDGTQYEDGRTAAPHPETGQSRAEEGVTVAVDPDQIPYGSRVRIPSLAGFSKNGDGVFVAHDTGGDVRSRRASRGTLPVLDVYVDGQDRGSAQARRDAVASAMGTDGLAYQVLPADDGAAQAAPPATHSGLFDDLIPQRGGGSAPTTFVPTRDAVPPIARNVTPTAVPVATDEPDVRSLIPGLPPEPSVRSLIPGLPPEKPQTPTVGQQASNAAREAFGGVVGSELGILEGVHRTRAGSNPATPASAAAYLDAQIASKQDALDRTETLLADRPNSGPLLQDRDRYRADLATLGHQRADVVANVAPGDVPGLGQSDLLTPEAQATRNAGAAEDTAQADRARDARREAPTAFGQDPALQGSIPARAARSAGGAVPLIGASLVPGVGAVAGPAVAGLEAKANSYDEYFQEAKARGESDEEARAGADQYSDAAALRTVPEMAAFLGTGKIAAGVVGKLLSPSAPAAVRALASAAASTVANAGAGTINQLVEQKATGKPLDASYSVERGVQDVLFGGMHGLSEAAPNRSGSADTAPAADVDTTSTARLRQRLAQTNGGTTDLPAIRRAASPAAVDENTVRGQDLPADPAGNPDVSPGVGAGDDGLTSTQNRVTAEERAKRGFAPAEQAARRDFGSVWDEANSTLDDDPLAGRRLVDTLNADPRPISDKENALLLRTQMDAQTEHDRAVQAVNDAPDDAERLSAQNRLAAAKDHLFAVYEATDKSGREIARGMNSRKMLAAQDYSLVNMLNRQRAANDGQPLNPKQTAQVEAMHARVADAQAQLAAHDALRAEVDAHLRGKAPAKEAASAPDWTVEGGDEAQAEAAHRASLEDDAHAGIEDAGGVELLDAVRQAGGLPTDDPVYRGELHAIRENSAPVGQAGRAGTFNLFRRSAPKLDELTSRLRSHGFDVQTPDDVFDLLHRRLTTKRPEYGFAARAEAQSGLASGEAYFRQGRPSAPRTPEELRPEQERWTRALQSVAPKTRLRLEVVRQQALDDLWQGQRRPTAQDGGSPHAAYLDGAIYLSERALRENAPQVSRVNFLHEIAHHFERALPEGERTALRDQWHRETASGRSPLHDAEGQPRADVDPRALDTSNPAHFSEWLAERVAWENEAHFSRTLSEALAGDGAARQSPVARLAAAVRRLVRGAWQAIRPGMKPQDLNARFREWLGRGARIDQAHEVEGPSTRQGAPREERQAQGTPRTLAERLAEHREGEGRNQQTEEEQRTERVRAALSGQDVPQFARRGPLTDAERLERAKKSLRRRRDELLRRVEDGDLETVKREKVKLDAEGLQLKAEHARAKQAFDEAVARMHRAQLPKSVRAMQRAQSLARAGAISGYHTLGKLASFSVGALAERPLTELTSAIIERTPGMRRIAAGADMESGSHVASLARFYNQFFTRGMREAAQVLRTGKSTDTALYGKPRPGEVFHWEDYVGRIHDAEKTPLFTAAQEAYRTKLIEHTLRTGGDPLDPVIHGIINQKAYEYALADKLQENNTFAKGINKFHEWLEETNPATGRASTEGVLLSTLLKVIITKDVVKTPANYLKQTLFERSPIGLARAIGKAGAAHVRGVEKLTPPERNAIVRLMKLGAVGTAMTLWGMYDATKDEKDRIFGGYYQPGDKRGQEDAKFGRIRIAGHVLPHYLSHFMILEPAQFGSTIMRVARSMRKKGGEQKGYTEGMFQAALAQVNNAPVVGSTLHFEQDSKQGGGAQVVNNIVANAVPGLVRNAAEDFDAHDEEGEPVKRKPVSISDAAKMNIPGLRQQVQEVQPEHPLASTFRRRRVQRGLSRGH